MKKTMVQWFCDRCGAEMAEPATTWHCAGRQQDYSGEVLRQFRVLVEYQEHTGVTFDQSMLCDKCKIEALEEVLKALKAKKKEHSK